MSCAEEGYLTVVEVKRYAYCPRIVFITHVLHLEEVASEAMQMGLEEHDGSVVAPLVSRLKASRVFRSVELASERLRVVGKLDFLLLTRFGEYVPVEIKWAESSRGEVKWDHKLQLATYALLVEENFNTTVKRGYAYYLREHRLAGVTIHEGLKRLATKTITDIHEMLEKERDPGVRVPISKCLSCGYKAFCRPMLQEGYIRKSRLARGLKPENQKIPKKTRNFSNQRYKNRNKLKYNHKTNINSFP